MSRDFPGPRSPRQHVGSVSSTTENRGRSPIDRGPRGPGGRPAPSGGATKSSGGVEQLSAETSIPPPRITGAELSDMVTSLLADSPIGFAPLGPDDTLSDRQLADLFGRPSEQCLRRALTVLGKRPRTSTPTWAVAGWRRCVPMIPPGSSGHGTTRFSTSPPSGRSTNSCDPPPNSSGSRCR